MATPLANPRYLTKYEVTKYIPGGKDNPAPNPTRIPKLKKKKIYILIYNNKSLLRQFNKSHLAYIL